MAEPIRGDWNRADQVLIEFYESHPPFNPGETAGRPFDEAEQLVTAGRAVYVDPPDGLNEFGCPVDPDPVPLPEVGELTGWTYGREKTEWGHNTAPSVG
jgi:hypothetical protein